MTRKKTLKLVENLANTLNKEKGMEDAATVMYVLAGTIALDNEEVLSGLSMHNIAWADQVLKAIQESQSIGGTPPPPQEKEDE